MPDSRDAYSVTIRTSRSIGTERSIYAGINGSNPGLDSR